MKNRIAGAFTLLVLAAPAWAATRTVTLNVSGISCAACPDYCEEGTRENFGRLKNRGSLRKKQVLVTFDDARTNTEALVKATSDSGYPSRVEKQAQ